MTTPKGTTYDRLIITGAGGMLGSAVSRAAIDNPDIKAVRPYFHEERDITNPKHLVLLEQVCDSRTTIINCAGMTEPRNEFSQEMLEVNAIAPHNLAKLARVVQVSTDCVFPEQGGPYSEESEPRPEDFYGYSKLMGELPDYSKHLTIRCSFVGFGQHGLVNDILVYNHNGYGQFPGFTNWLWSGWYAEELARIIVEMAYGGQAGLIHLPGGLTSKYCMARDLAPLFRPNLIARRTTARSRSRVLVTEFSKLDYLVSDWSSQFHHLANDWNQRESKFWIRAYR